MKKCVHKKTLVVMGPIEVRVACKDCGAIVSGVRYGKQTGALQQLPEWAHTAYLQSVLMVGEEILEEYEVLKMKE